MAGDQVITRLREALNDIALYPLPVFDIERDGITQQMVPLENADWLRMIAKQALHLEVSSPPQPATGGLRATAPEQIIERELKRLEAISFVVDMALVTSKKNCGGLTVVVNYSDAMHALLFVRQALRSPSEDASRALKYVIALMERDLAVAAPIHEPIIRGYISALTRLLPKTGDK